MRSFLALTPGEDDFQQLREEVDKPCASDVKHAATLAQRLLTQRTKDLRVAVYFLWARTQDVGMAGFAEGLSLLAALLERYCDTVLPSRLSSRRAALLWVASPKVLDGLAMHSEVRKADVRRTVGALVWLQQLFDTWPEPQRPPLVEPLTAAICGVLARAGQAAVSAPQTAASEPPVPSPIILKPSAEGMPLSARDLLEHGKLISRHLHDQPEGWLAGHRLITALRWDTLHQLPLVNGAGHAHLVAPRDEYRAQLKRLYTRQQWGELLNTAERLFTEGANHFWLDLQWYICQALARLGAPHDAWSEMVRRDLAMFLERLPGLEGMHWNDASPFADPQTREWIDQDVSSKPRGQWLGVAVHSQAGDVLSLEPQVLELAASNGAQAALIWLSERPDIHTVRERWQLRLLMARVAEQYGKPELAAHLLSDLESEALRLGIVQWEPSLSFEVQARLLGLLRQQALRSGADKAALRQRMDDLMSRLVATDPVRAAVLCD